ncbi:pyridoxamine 5'-phosphate oxidase family protein [Streptomyces sp. NPDC001185]|uniref:pyridoxamine 5'-phosphate oxidase family protein n=1 Tax=Streptomyces sp. NPDC001185 TaxID=3154380 RepID=UPI0033207843
MSLNDGFCELDRDQCLRLLSRAPFGRVVHTRHALPAVLPVAFTLDTDSAVLMRTSAGSELAAAIDGAVIAFEADEMDAAARCGWSVVVTGRATTVIDPIEHGRLIRTGPRARVASPEEVFIRVEPELVTGRRFAGGLTVYRPDISS